MSEPKVSPGRQPSPELVMMMLADARLPVGAYTQSAGLEPAFLAGLGLNDVPLYMATRLRTVTAAEAGAAVVARQVTAAGGPSWRESLEDVQVAWVARTPSPALRRVSMQLARGQLRLARVLWPHDPQLATLADGTVPCRAAVLGVVAALGRLSAEQLARLVCYDDVHTVASAALKLFALDPAKATQWAVSCYPQIDDVVAEVCGLTRPDQIPSRAAPLIEHWAQRHAYTRERLFSA